MKVLKSYKSCQAIRIWYFTSYIFQKQIQNSMKNDESVE
jgi:hypothetical protein